MNGAAGKVDRGDIRFSPFVESKRALIRRRYATPIIQRVVPVLFSLIGEQLLDFGFGLTLASNTMADTVLWLTLGLFGNLWQIETERARRLYRLTIDRRQ